MYIVHITMYMDIIPHTTHLWHRIWGLSDEQLLYGNGYVLICLLSIVCSNFSPYRGAPGTCHVFQKCIRRNSNGGYCRHTQHIHNIFMSIDSILILNSRSKADLWYRFEYKIPWAHSGEKRWWWHTMCDCVIVCLMLHELHVYDIRTFRRL